MIASTIDCCDCGQYCTIEARIIQVSKKLLFELDMAGLSEGKPQFVYAQKPIFVGEVYDKRFGRTTLVRQTQLSDYLAEGMRFLPSTYPSVLAKRPA